MSKPKKVLKPDARDPYVQGVIGTYSRIQSFFDMLSRGEPEEPKAIEDLEVADLQIILLGKLANDILEDFKARLIGEIIDGREHIQQICMAEDEVN